MHNFIGINNKTDNFRKGVYIDPYDEPTFLTFSIDFNFEGSSSTLMAQHLWDSPLFVESDGGMSNYLSSRGYSDKAHSIKVFKEILRYLTFDAPWYFQSVSGLNTMWKQATDVDGGWKSKGLSLTVETLEAVDFRITELADIYRNAVYDKVYMRERVPDNLRWFSMDIYIAEARNLRFRLPGIGQNVATTFGINTATLGNILGGGNLLSNVLEQYGYVKFKCRQCEFDFSDSFAGGSKLEVTTKNTPATNSFKINIGYFEEESKYPDGSRLYDDFTSSDVHNPWSIRNIGTTTKNMASFLSGMPVIGDDIQRAGQKVQESLAKIGGLINPTLGAASAFLDPPVKNLGNVYRR